MRSHKGGLAKARIVLRRTDESARIRVMPNQPDIRRDSIVVPNLLQLQHPEHVKRLAEDKARSSVGPNERVVFVQLGAVRDVPGTGTTDVEVSFAYEIAGRK